jgi:hypothetical protein
MSASIDLEITKPDRLHLATGTVVLAIGYFALIVLVVWLWR